MKEGTPLITTLPYVYEAFSQVYAIDEDPKWLRIMRSIAEHAFSSYRDLETAPDAASCAYTPAPDDPAGVINASAYRAFLLTKAGIELSEPRYLEVARRNLNFVLASQNADGSWYYSTDGERDFVDHFHTCFVLKGPRKDRATYGMVLGAEVPSSGDRLLREESVRRKRPAAAIFQARRGSRYIAGSSTTMRSVSTWRSSCTAAFPSWTGSCPAVVTESARRDGKNPMAHFGRASFCSAGTMSRCIAGRSRRCFEVSAFCCSRNLRQAPRRDCTRFLPTIGVERLRRRRSYVRHLRTI